MLKILSVFSVLFLISCSAPQVKVVDHIGRPLPKNYYVAKDVAGSNLQCLFYFVEYKIKTDIDGSKIYIPNYLDWRGNYEFKKGSFLEIVIDVHNQKDIRYLIYERLILEKDSNINKHSFSKVRFLGASNQPYRSFKIRLPTETEEGYSKISFLVEITNEDGLSLIKIGPFKYMVLGQ